MAFQRENSAALGGQIYGGMKFALFLGVNIV
jgi:hypothetical protein